MHRYVRVFAPATVANVGAGFDVFGFAIHGPGDEIEATLQDEPGVTIREITGDGGRLPLSAEKNTAGVAALSLLHSMDCAPGVALSIHKKMPLGSGLGSSAASAVGAAIAVNELLGRPLRAQELLPHCVAGEKIASGTAHLDNVAPALLGGFVIVRSAEEPFDVITIPTPAELYAVVVYPHIELLTAEGRKLLPEALSLQKGVSQWGNTAAMVAALFLGDYALIGRALEDHIAEPVRAPLIPCYQEVQEGARKAGALGCTISGAGPSILALCEGEARAQVVGEIMQNALQRGGHASSIYSSSINVKGTHVLELQ